jgi:hypothetical protein
LSLLFSFYFISAHIPAGERCGSYSGYLPTGNCP